jgi:hypothetical protein
MKEARRKIGKSSCPFAETGDGAAPQMGGGFELSPPYKRKKHEDVERSAIDRKAFIEEHMAKGIIKHRGARYSS